MTTNATKLLGLARCAEQQTLGWHDPGRPEWMDAAGWHMELRLKRCDPPATVAAQNWALPAARELAALLRKHSAAVRSGDERADIQETTDGQVRVAFSRALSDTSTVQRVRPFAEEEA